MLLPLSVRADTDVSLPQARKESSPMITIRKQAKAALAKLLKLSGGKFWNLYYCQGQIFVDKSNAIAHARKHAKLTSDYIDILKMKIPTSMPDKYVTGFKDVPIPIGSMPPVNVFIVEGQIYSTLEEAKRVAIILAKSSQDFIFIRMATIEMHTTELIDGVRPEPKSHIADEPAADEVAA